MKYFLLLLLLAPFPVGTFSMSVMKHANGPKDLSTAAERAEVMRISALSFAMEKKDPGSAIRLARKGLALSRKIHYLFGEALMMGRFSSINEDFGNFDTAIKYQKEAFYLYSHLRMPAYIAGSTLATGRILGKMHQFSAGIIYLKKASGLFQQNKDKTGEIRTLITLGEIYELNGKNKEALSYDMQAEKRLNGVPLSDTYFSLISHIAALHEKLGNDEQALSQYEIAVSKSDEPKFGKWHISLLRQAGLLWDKLGNSKKALIFHQRSISKAKSFSMPEEEARSHITLAMSQKNTNIVESIGHLNKALSMSKQLGSHLLTAEILQGMSKLYAQQSHYQQALVLFQAHHKILDSLQQVNTGHKLALLEGSFEIADNKLHIRNLELNNRKEVDERNASFMILLVILLVLVLITIFYYRTRKLNRELRTANTVKDKLFSIIGHDLLNPVGGMTQILGLMDEQELSPQETKEMVAVMRKQSDVILQTLNGLLKWGHAQLKGIHVSKQVFDPRIYIEQNLEILKKQASDKNLRTVIDMPDNLSVTGDVNHFDFIIRNLISNAIKFSPVGSDIKISAVQDKTGTTFSVHDHGQGISAAQQLQFLQANLDVSFGTNGEKGTGLGLLLSKEYVKVNQGKLWIQSEMGSGTTFLFTFGTI